jgi:hypothetical protein
LVNTLEALEFPRTYWIYSKEPATAYLPVGSATLSHDSHGLSQTPPATYYGFIQSGADFAPETGMRLTAEIDDIVCGESVVVLYAGQMAYSIQVQAESGGLCGRSGKTVVFRVGDQILPGTELAWDNSQAWYHPLSVGGLQNSVFLPMQIR